MEGVGTITGKWVVSTPGPIAGVLVTYNGVQPTLHMVLRGFSVAPQLVKEEERTAKGHDNWLALVWAQPWS